jgi:ankyrin repeat protein
VRLLVGAPGIDVNRPTDRGTTPLLIASRRGHIDCVRVLIEMGNAKTEDVDTPLVNEFCRRYVMETVTHKRVLEELTIALATTARGGGTKRVKTSQLTQTE